jgi:hypothetical protein
MTRRDKPPEWSVRCPWCQAPPGTRCTSPRGRRLAVDSHDARIQAHTASSRPAEGASQ